MKKKKPKYASTIEMIERSSLGISIVVAIALGTALGLWLKNISGWSWFLPIGIIWGVGAAIYNVYKAYQKQKKEFDELKNEQRYKKQNSDDKH